MPVQAAPRRLDGAPVLSGPVPRQPNPEPDLPTPPGEPDPADGLPGEGHFLIAWLDRWEPLAARHLDAVGRGRAGEATAPAR